MRDEYDVQLAGDIFQRWLLDLGILHIRRDRKRAHAGAPHFILPTLRAAVLFKRAEGCRILPRQDDWLKELEAAGWHTSIAFGFDDAAQFIIEELAIAGGGS